MLEKLDSAYLVTFEKATWTQINFSNCFFQIFSET